MAGTEEAILNSTSEAINDDPGDDVPAEGEEDKGSETRLPIARIKRIMKADPDLNLASQDAVFLIAKATEMFVASLAQEAYQFTCKSRKKTMSRRDLDSSIETIEALAFLDGALD